MQSRCLGIVVVREDVNIAGEIRERPKRPDRDARQRGREKQGKAGENIRLVPLNPDLAGDFICCCVEEMRADSQADSALPVRVHTILLLYIPAKSQPHTFFSCFSCEQLCSDVMVW